MKITIKVYRDEFLEEKYFPVYRLLKKYRWRWQAVGAVLSLSGGLLSPIIGLVLNSAVSFTRLVSERPVLDKLSTALYIVSVPLLLLGAHFLDLLEQKSFELPMSRPESVEPVIGHLGLPAKAEDF